MRVARRRGTYRRMKSLPFLLVLGLPLVALAGPEAAPAPPPPSPFQAVADTARPGIVTVQGYDKDGALLRARPGFFVGDAHVVTVRHPLVGAQRAEVVLAGDTSLPVTGIEADDPALDLVLLHVAVPTDAIELGTAGRLRRALRGE